MDEKPPGNLKAMLSEAKDASELMVDLAYAALFFDDPAMAEEVERLRKVRTSNDSSLTAPDAKSLTTAGTQEHGGKRRSL